MSALTLRFLDAAREPLDDELDVIVSAVQTNNEVARQRGVSGQKKLRITDVNPNQTYLVRAFPVRHRPVGQFAMVSGSDKPTEVDLSCPVDPQRVSDVKWPAYADLDVALRNVLERSILERDAATVVPPADGTPGEALFGGLTPMERAGLLNLFCKMNHTPLGDRTTWSFVTDVYRVRGDRIFTNVTLEFRDRVKTALAGGEFKEVDSSLHTPPPDISPAGSFKTLDHYGNLQLTFFSSVDAPLKFKLDADIDDAAGIEHAFQVLDHALTRGETHPYDIHEILTFYQRLDVGYELLV